MTVRPFARLAFVFVLGGCSLVACAPNDDDDDFEVTGVGVQGLSREIAINRLLDDANIEGDQHVTVAEVQAFLASQGSGLSQYSADGRTAAQWIVDESRAEQISPVYMLARIETESGMVRSSSLARLAKATGCGCPDTAQCNPAFANFGLQVRCAAQKMRGYFKSLAASGQTISGWRVGIGRSTSDPCWVTPENKATAALYTYTPWVGAYGIGCGTSKWGGSTLVAGLYKTFRAAFGNAPANPQPQPQPQPAACTLGDGLYCGGNGTPGDPTRLYRCTGGKSAVVSTCALGCKRMPSGTADACATGDACPLGNGTYCGGNAIGGDPTTLYQCASGKITVKTECAKSCRRMPVGQPDACE